MQEISCIYWIFPAFYRNFSRILQEHFPHFTEISKKCKKFPAFTGYFPHFIGIFPAFYRSISHILLRFPINARNFLHLLDISHILQEHFPHFAEQFTGTFYRKCKKFRAFYWNIFHILQKFQKMREISCILLEACCKNTVQEISYILSHNSYNRRM